MENIFSISTELLKIFVDAIPNVVFIKDRDSKFILLNTAGEKQLGLRHEDLVGTDASQYFPAEQMVHFTDIDKKAFERGEPFDMEEVVWSAENKQNRICHTFKNPVFDEYGNPLYLICTMIDVTEKKNTEENLRSINEKLKNVIETSLDGYWQVDVGGNIVDVNSSACTMLGFTRLEMLGKNVSEIEVNDNIEAIRARIEKIKLTGCDRFESCHRRKDGKIIDVEVSINMIPSVRLMSCFIRDISIRKSVENQIITARNEAERANMAKSLFLALISHDLRTPMNGVLGMLELVLSSNVTDEQSAQLKVAQSSAQNMVLLLNDILDLSKMESGKMELEYISFNIRHLLSETIKSLSVNAKSKGLDLIYSIDDLIPSNIEGDPTRLRQIITNLVGNAIKFTDTGRIYFSVTVENLNATKILLRFSVVDTGIGIQPEKQLTIFNSFTQADSSTTRKFGGTGLGLSICRKLVTLMGGQISVESKFGIGSDFSFTVEFNLTTKMAETQPSETASTENQQFVKLNILVAEDVPASQLFFTTVLSKAGHSVTLVEDGEKAVNCVKDHTFDIILMDVSMPNMDGFDATKMIRSLGIETPIIALTAHVLPEFRDNCIEAGMTDYISKPIRSVDLLNKVKEVGNVHSQNI